MHDNDFLFFFTFTETPDIKRVHWEDQANDNRKTPKLEFDGVPFVCGGTSQLECSTNRQKGTETVSIKINFACDY